MSKRILTIGSRASPLALAQAQAFVASIAHATGEPKERFPVVPIMTTGDAIGDKSLADIGGKGLFTKEIDQTQIAEEIDVGVHSAKDLPTFLPEELIIGACLPREDPRDVFIGRQIRRIADVPPNALIGTASARRSALILRERPDLNIRILRGNIGTRLLKIQTGLFSGTLLALAGLKRLNVHCPNSELLDLTRFPPAVGQGTIAAVVRKNDPHAAALVRQVNHAHTACALTAERALLAALNGSCRSPIAGYASFKDDKLQLHGLVASPDGKIVLEGRDKEELEYGSALGARLKEYGSALGARLGSTLRNRYPPGFEDLIG